MSLNNGIITAPVSIDDVKGVLGESSNDIATLCTSKNINMWAKYKPTSYPAPFPSDWYKGSDGNYGLDVPTDASVGNVANLVAKYSLENNGYGSMYKRPTGGSSSPYRLGDFRGYRHDANPELKDILPTNVFVSGSGDYKLGVSYNPISENGDQIMYKEFAEFKDKYFGFVIYTSGGSYYTICTANETVSTGNYSVPLANARLSVGEYIAYPMFCSAKYYGYTQNNFSLVQMTLCAVPNLSPKAFSVVSSASVEYKKYKSITAKYTDNSYTSAKVHLITKEAVTNITVYCVYQTDPTTNANTVQGESYVNIDSIPADFDREVDFINLNSNKDYKIYVYSGSSWIVKGQAMFKSNFSLIV